MVICSELQTAGAGCGGRLGYLEINFLAKLCSVVSKIQWLDIFFTKHHIKVQQQYKGGDITGLIFFK